MLTDKHYFSMFQLDCNFTVLLPKSSRRRVGKYLLQIYVSINLIRIDVRQMNYRMHTMIDTYFNINIKSSHGETSSYTFTTFVWKVNITLTRAAMNCKLKHNVVFSNTSIEWMCITNLNTTLSCQYQHRHALQTWT